MTAPRSTGKRSEQPRDARTPPHNLDAERSLLGAAMLNPAAFDVLVAQTNPGDYYAPRHQHIASAMHGLALRGAPADVVTVGEQLRRAGLFDEIGGNETLLELTNATPATSRAATYARIVKETSSARRVIAVSAELADLGYAGTDPGTVVDRATALLAAAGLESAEDLSTLEIADVAALLDGDLEPEPGTLLARSDGTALLYPGKMHTIQAEPSSGKSWLGVLACSEVLTLGGSAVWIDYEDTARGILRRLREIGLDPGNVRSRFAYMQPVSGFTAAERRALWKIVDDLNPDLVVIDGVGEALAREGLSEDSAPDFLKWIDLPRSLARTGAAVLMLDHVSKDPEQRGRWARGTGAKLGVIDGAVFQLKVTTSFSRQTAGTAKLIVAKDRPGNFAVGDTAAVLTITPHAGGERVVIAVDPDTSRRSPTDPFRPTETMQKVYNEVQNAVVPLTATSVAGLIHGPKARTIREAVERLISEGFLAAQGRSRTLRIVRPFGEGSARPDPPPPRLFEDELPPDDPSDTSWIDDAYLEGLH
jgi:hypothetical protein